MEKELSLKWDQHYNTFLGVFEEFLETSTLVDCTIAAEGQYLKAHKVVLSACSSYFQLLFAQENEKNPIVVLKDIKFADLKELINFMYRGCVKIPEDRLPKFVEIAESLQIKGLAECSPKNTGKTAKAGGDKEYLTSPIPRKRRRNSSGNVIEENQKSSSDHSSRDSSTRGSKVPCEVRVDLPQSSSATSASSRGAISGAATATACLPNTEQEKRVVESRPSTSQEKPVSSEERLPDADAVIKVEPEETQPITQIFLSETKEEEYEDDMTMLQCEEGTSEPVPGDNSQQSTSQFPGFQSMFESSNDTFMASQQTAELKTTQGVGPSTYAAHSAVVDGGLASVSDVVKLLEQDAASTSCPPPQELQVASPFYVGGRPRDMRELHFPRSWAGRRRRLPRSDWRYECSECRKPFKTPALLERHIRTHTGERPFACDVCGFTFKEASHLRVHARKHVEKMMRSCDLCGYTVRRVEHLSAHICKPFHGIQ